MEINESAVRESLVAGVRTPAQISWGAIFAGWVVGFGISLLLYQLGAAIGATAIDPAEGQILPQGLGIGTGIWLLITWLVSLFVGGWYGGRVAGRTSRNNGILHGVAVWAVTMAVTLFIAAMGITNLVQGAAGLIGGGIQAGAGAAQAADGGLQNAIRQQVAQVIAQQPGITQQEASQAMQQLDAQTLSAIATQLLQGNTQQAANILAANTALEQQQVQQVINNLQGQLPQFQQQARQAAQQATAATATFLWVTFFVTLLALAAAAWGGALGSRQAAKDYAARRDEALRGQP